MAVDGFRRDMRHVAHRHLDLFRLLAEFAAGGHHHQADDRQDGHHHQRQLPVRPKQVGEQEYDRQPFADDDLDGIGGGAGHHRDIEGDARNQVAGIVLVEIAVGQGQQAVEQGHAQVMHDSHRHARQEEIAEVGTDALPQGDQHHQQRHGMHHLQSAQRGDVAQRGGLRVDQAIDEILEHRRQHRLRRGEDHVTENAGGKQPRIRLDVAQQAEIDGQAGSGVRIGRGHVQAARRERS